MLACLQYRELTTSPNRSTHPPAALTGSKCCLVGLCQPPGAVLSRGPHRVRPFLLPATSPSEPQAPPPSLLLSQQPQACPAMLWSPVPSPLGSLCSLNSFICQGPSVSDQIVVPSIHRVLHLLILKAIPSLMWPQITFMFFGND